mmetsp:Transcript_85478/g.275123  ORF Transcript_85478/g.275123 Transcript_85478/m.275123 type:complete len:299 (+) Transcript_85478:559-1455(+)
MPSPLASMARKTATILDACWLIDAKGPVLDRRAPPAAARVCCDVLGVLTLSPPSSSLFFLILLILPHRHASEALLDLHRGLLHVRDQLVRRRAHHQTSYGVQGLLREVRKLRAGASTRLLVNHGKVTKELLHVHPHMGLVIAVVPGHLARLSENLASQPIQLRAGETEVKHAQDLSDLFDVDGSVSIGIEQSEGLVQIHVQSDHSFVNMLHGRVEEGGVFVGLHVHDPPAQESSHIYFALRIDQAPMLGSVWPRVIALDELRHEVPPIVDHQSVAQGHVHQVRPQGRFPLNHADDHLL